jgi:hypothetical protein
MTTIVILLALFGIKHFVADFVLQFDYMLGQKGTYGAAGGVDHAGIHGALTALLLLPFINPMLASVLGLLDMALHYHIDWAKTNLSRGLTPADRKFWIWLGADQGLHYLTYILIIGIIVL